MKISIKLFAFLQDQLGPTVTIEVTNPVRVEDILAQVSQLAPQLNSTLVNSRLAVNQEFVDSDKISITENDEIAIVPPVSGG